MLWGFSHLFQRKAETLAQIERFIKRISQYGYGFFAVERKDTQQFIGFTGLSCSPDSTKLFYSLC